MLLLLTSSLILAMPATRARRSRRDVLRMGAGALGAALMAACTGGSEQPVPPSPTAAPRSTIDVLDGYPGAAGPRGGVVRLGAVGRRGLNDASLPLTHAQLVAVDPRSAQVYADLAQAVELVDSLTAVFTLRPELRFHPDAAGVVAALTAESVARDFEARTGAGEYLFSEVIEHVTAADEATLRQFVARLREGPPFSAVDDVDYRWEDPTGEFVGFEAVI